MDKCDVASDLLQLRRDLLFEGLPVGEHFHCTSDKQAIRNRVFEAILGHKFTVQATIMEKAKAQPQIKSSPARFYQHGWLYHFRHGTKPLTHPFFEEEMPNILVTAATIGTGKERASFLDAIHDVMRQTVPGRWTTHFCPAATDPCVQVADYCAWAIQRKWERGGTLSFGLIKDRITYEYELWSHGKILYY
jgi:hypothetical protein